MAKKGPEQLNNQPVAPALVAVEPKKRSDLAARLGLMFLTAGVSAGGTLAFEHRTEIGQAAGNAWSEVSNELSSAYEHLIHGETNKNITLKGDLFHTPVHATSTVNRDSAWLIAEPGVINTNETAWTIAETDQPYHQNVPEGGFAYFSLGQGDIEIDGARLHLEGAKGLNYVVLIRGKIDDGIVDSDLNTTATVTNFVPGHAIWAYMPKGAYISKNWVMDQVKVSTTEGGTNCGATGCSTTRIVLFDVGSHTYQMFETVDGRYYDWRLTETNVGHK